MGRFISYDPTVWLCACAVFCTALHATEGEPATTFSCPTPDRFSGGCSKQWEWRAPHGTYSVHYVEHGSGEQHVLLVHGYTSNTYTWRKTLRALGDAGYHAWALDLVGFGSSCKPPDAPYSLDFFIDQVHDFMQTHAIHQAHLVGHSMGGGIAIGAVMRQEESFHSLTLVDSLGYPIELPWSLRLAKGLGEWLSPLLSRDMVVRMLRASSSKPEIINDELIDAYWLPLAAEGGRQAAIRVMAQFDNRMLEKFSLGFRSIQIPTLIVWGGKDELIPLGNAYRFHRDLRRSHLRVFPECGHSPQEERPDDFLHSLSTFLRRYVSQEEANTGR